MSNQERYDAIIIGAGQSGTPLSTTLASAGWTVALVECEHVGGSCINEGCTPTKTMVASARVAHVVRRAADYGIQTGPISVDMGKVRQRKRDIVSSFRSGSQGRVEAAENADLLMGEARFIGPKTIEVDLNAGGTRRLTAEKIFVNTGAQPRVPALPGLEGVPYLNSTTIMELGEVPDHLLIIGGGYVGLEFGQMFRRFGSQVTILQRGAQLLSREDPDIAQEIAEILREDGIQVLLETEPVRAELEEGGQIRLTLENAHGQGSVAGSHLLIAAGRVPSTQGLGLEVAGVETDGRGHIKVNDRLETNVEGIWALGDVKGGPAFTHISYDDFRIIRTNLLEGGGASIADRMVPYTVFIDPQLGRVGLTEKRAREEGRNIRVAKMPMSYVARALEVDETRGLMKAIVDADTEQILGVAILGVEGGEIMAIVQVAMMGGLRYTALRDGIFTHPTLSESLNNLFSSLEE